MIARFKKFDTGALMQMSHHFCRKVRMPIQARAHRGAAESKLTQDLDCLFRARLGIGHLLSVTAKFLTESDRCRVHQVRSSDLNNVIKLFRLTRKGVE